MSGGLRVLILEDEWAARDFLAELVTRTGRGQVVGAVGGLDEANALLSSESDAAGVDVVFVDIQLAGEDGTGLDLVRRWASVPDAPTFVLATALREHALEAFDLGIADYVLKPFTEARIAQCLERVHARRRSKTSLPRRMVARDKRALVFLDPQQVWAFEASDRLTVVHAPRGVFDIDLTLAAVELSLGASFTRVHRQWLVNEAHIRGIDRDAGDMWLLVGAEVGDGRIVRVPVSRDRAQSLRNELLEGTIGIRRR